MDRKWKKKVIGIDLGTTNSLVAYIKETKPEIIPNERGSRVTPSVVMFKEGETIVGELAKNQQVLNSDHTVANVKLLMGEDHSFEIDGKDYNPSEISSFILSKLKKYSERYLEKEIKEVVITVPAYFDDRQREATLKAAELSGLKVLKLLNEPTAAALTYGYDKKEDGNFLVLDMGGGTLDITLMECKDKVFRVRGVGGSTSIGGNNFDQAIIQFILEDFKKINSIDLSQDRIASQQVAINAEKAKKDLSSVETTHITIPYITVTKEGPMHLNCTLTREQFDHLIADTIKKIRQHIIETFEESDLTVDWIDSVILVGGSTRVPAVEKLVSMLILEELDLPENKKKDINLFMNDYLRREIHPDEAVALGAGIMAGILEGTLKDIEFHDITSHNLGLEDDEGEFIPLIEKGTVYPAQSSRLFTTSQDYQEEVCIHILQDRGLKEQKEYVSLGMFQLPCNKELKKGEPNIDVTFKIDSNGVLIVSAVDIDTNEIKEIKISDRRVS